MGHWEVSLPCAGLKESDGEEACWPRLRLAEGKWGAGVTVFFVHNSVQGPVLPVKGSRRGMSHSPIALPCTELLSFVGSY